MNFLVVTNAPTLHQDEKYLAYAPYVIEMDIWFKNVQQVGIISPGTYPDTVFTKEFHRQNIKFFKIPFFKFTTLRESIFLLIVSPYILFQIIRAFMWADHIHLRCPGNIGLLGCFMQIFFPHKPKTAKYAGNWDPEAKQPWTYQLQKWILSNTFLTQNMTVLVYGNWPNQSENILPFFTASFAEREKGKTIKSFSSPYKFLFVGNLVPGKQPLFALRLVEALKEKHINAELHVYGDGELMDALKDHAKNNAYIHFHGNQPLEVLKQAYKDSHFLVLASESEGWPKAVAEAMFFGCIPISTAVSCVPWMLNYGSRGILIPGIEQAIEKRGKTGDNIVDRGQRPVDSRDVLGETVDRVMELIRDQEELSRMSLEAQQWSQQYTLEKFEAEIKKLLVAPQPPKGEQKGKL